MNKSIKAAALFISIIMTSGSSFAVNTDMGSAYNLGKKIRESISNLNLRQQFNNARESIVNTLSQKSETVAPQEKPAWVKPAFIVGTACAAVYFLGTFYKIVTQSKAEDNTDSQEESVKA